MQLLARRWVPYALDTVRCYYKPLHASRQALSWLLHISRSRRDKIKSQAVWERTGQEEMRNRPIIGRRSLRWMWHVARWRQKDGLYRPWTGWSPEGKRRRGRPRKNWQKTIREEIRCMDMTWRKAIDLVEDREGWRDCVARCADLHRKD